MKPTPETKKVTQRLRCNLSDEEKINAGKELAEATNELSSIEEDKTQVMADFKAQVTAQEAKVSMLSNKLRSGYELRNVQCEVIFGVPESHQKQTVRLDTNEIVSTETMSEEEKQGNLPLEESNAL